ncbi:hypothetical protein BDV19DRAFT_213331 [Aspergillus venezuelensis]
MSTRGSPFLVRCTCWVLLIYATLCFSVLPWCLSLHFIKICCACILYSTFDSAVEIWKLQTPYN